MTSPQTLSSHRLVSFVTGDCGVTFHFAPDRCFGKLILAKERGGMFASEIAFTKNHENNVAVYST